MSDIFESDIDSENINLSALEDSEAGVSSEEFVYDGPLYNLKLAYSCESVYAKNDKNIDVRVGESVIIQTRYGRDMTKVMGISKKPVGIKPCKQRRLRKSKGICRKRKGSKPYL